MEVKYNKSDLKNNSTKLSNIYSDMNTVLTDLNKLKDSISTHWQGSDQVQYLQKYLQEMAIIGNYSKKINTMASKLNKIAELYDKHEEEHK